MNFLFYWIDIDMVRRRFYQHISTQAAEVNLAPLIDMIFILLIFFLVTTSFVKEAGVDVHRPSATVAESLTRDNIFIGIDKSGGVYMNSQEVSLLSVRAIVKEQLRLRKVPVVIVTDKQTPTQYLVDVIDECKLAGADKISLAAEKE